MTRLCDIAVLFGPAANVTLTRCQVSHQIAEQEDIALPHERVAIRICGVRLPGVCKGSRCNVTDGHFEASWGTFAVRITFMFSQICVKVQRVKH